MIAFLRTRRTALLAVFMAAELAVMLFLLALHAWPRSVPEFLGWAIYFGSYPWSMPWLAHDPDDVPVTMIVITSAFGLNVVLATALGWYGWSRRRGASRGAGLG